MKIGHSWPLPIFPWILVLFPSLPYSFSNCLAFHLRDPCCPVQVAGRESPIWLCLILSDILMEFSKFSGYVAMFIDEKTLNLGKPMFKQTHLTDQKDIDIFQKKYLWVSNVVILKLHYSVQCYGSIQLTSDQPVTCGNIDHQQSTGMYGDTSNQYRVCPEIGYPKIQWFIINFLHETCHSGVLYYVQTSLY